MIICINKINLTYLFTFIIILEKKLFLLKKLNILFTHKNQYCFLFLLIQKKDQQFLTILAHLYLNF